MNVNKTTKRKLVLSRLEEQLKSNNKPKKFEGKDSGMKTELTEQDVKRIKQEISKLKELV
jgi:hypothetical protein